MLLTLIKNEFIKIFRRGKTWIVFALFLAFIALTIFGTWKTDKDFRYYASPEYQIQMSEEQLAYLERSYEEAKSSNDAQWLESIESNIEYFTQNIEDNKYILENGIDEDAWKAEIINEIKNVESLIADIEKEGINEYNNQQYNYLKDNLELLNYLNENEIEPLEGWEYHAYNFLSNTSSLFGLSLLVAGIAVFMSDIVSGESTPATLKFLLVQPVSRGKILFSKYIVSIITVLALIIIPEVIGMGVVNLTSDIHPSDYPVTIGQEYEKVFDSGMGEMILEEIPDTAKTITNFEYAKKIIGYQVIFIIATCSVIFMFSTLFKSSMVSMATSVILTVFLTIGAQAISTLRKISHLLFTTYADSASILNSSYALGLNNEKITITNGLICMGITIIVTYLISHINFTKKDILI